MLRQGTIVGERYEVISRVGSGGMADVYKAKDHKLNRLVAVKVMKAEFSEDKNFIAKFRKEAQAAAALTHPNIVSVFDVGEDNGIYYIVMELIQGITLKDYITRKGRLTVREATSIAIQVSLGLEAAHKSGVIHRDVKPQNIIISTDGKVKLSDFGIARAASSNTISSNVMGSVHYSSPEQVRGGYSDAKSDIYSLGITIYEMITGKVPFDGDTTVAIAIKHLQEEMESPRKYAPDMPYSLEQIILKCTQKSVERRYVNMTALIEDLKRSLLDPNGRFVVLTPLANHAQTVMISPGELEAIREGRSGYAAVQKPKEVPPVVIEEDNDEEEEEEIKIVKPSKTAKTAKSKYVEEEDEDEEEDTDAADEDDDDDDEEESSSKFEKAITIGGFIIGALVIAILIFVIAREAGFLNFGKDNGPGYNQEQNGGDNNDENDGNNGEANNGENNGSDADNKVAVPNLLNNMTEENALNVLKQLGLEAQKDGESASDVYEAGTIMSQNIEAGTKVEVGTIIKYVVSTGVESPTIPNVLERSQSTAEAMIKVLGLDTVIEQEYSDDHQIGTIIRVEPEVGTQVEKGSKVTLVVSLGEENKKVKVPSVVNEDPDEAKTKLNDLGIQVNIETTTTAADDIEDGKVAEQSIKAGTEVDPGTTITLKVFDKPDPTPTPTEEPSADPTPTPGPDAVWKCYVELTQPANYTNGLVKLVLIQEVDGQNVETVILEDDNISFPYTLEYTGAPGVETGVIYLYEKVEETYIERGHYNGVAFNAYE